VERKEAIKGQYVLIKTDVLCGTCSGVFGERGSLRLWCHVIHANLTIWLTQHFVFCLAVLVFRRIVP